MLAFYLSFYSVVLTFSTLRVVFNVKGITNKMYSYYYYRQVNIFGLLVPNTTSPMLSIIWEGKHLLRAVMIDIANSQLQCMLQLVKSCHWTLRDGSTCCLHSIHSPNVPRLKFKKAREKKCNFSLSSESVAQQTYNAFHNSGHFYGRNNKETHNNFDLRTLTH